MPTYENKVLTGDKLVTLVSLIKTELESKATLSDVGRAIDGYFSDNDITIEDNAIQIEVTLGDEDEELASSRLTADGLEATRSMDGEYEDNATYNEAGADFESKSITDEQVFAGGYSSGTLTIRVSEYDPQTNTTGDTIALFNINAETDGTITMNAIDENADPIPVLLNGEQLATIDGIISELGGTPGTDTLADVFDDRSEEHIREHGFQTASDVTTAIADYVTSEHLVTRDSISEALESDTQNDLFNTAYSRGFNPIATMADIPDISGKQDALVFNTAYNASSNKVATMSDVSGKQDALVFNTAYNASSNKVATMADIPSVSAFQTASDVQTAITTAISGITSFGFQIVSTLPVSNISQTTIYLVLKSSGGASGNIYTEYAYVKTGTDSITGEDVYGWETLGDTAVTIETLSTADINAIWNYVSEL